MTDEKKKAIMSCTSFDEILNEEYGAMGTPDRMKFENDTEAFCLAETLKEQRRLASLTQQELAESVGVTRQTINALENARYNPSLLLAYKIAKFLGENSIEDVFVLN